MSGRGRAMRLVAVGLGMIAGASAAQAQAPPTSGPCFQVIAGQADVAPAAPMLVDRCTGETFVLVRGPRNDGKAASYVWTPLGKSAAEPAVRPTSTAKAATKAGCFDYNGKSYCP